ncbi:MAG: hypothetical protein ABIH28_00145 [archaeon]
MRIALINQKTGYDNEVNLPSYLEKVGRIARESGAEIVIGPELALGGAKNILDFYELNEQVNSLASGLKGKLVIPGTGLVKETGLMRNVAPIILKDGRVAYHFKNSSHCEDSVAQTNGLEYERGNVKNGLFGGEEPSFAIEICRDHGIGKLRSVAPFFDFHFILENNLTGVSQERALIKEGGIVALVDGFDASSYAYQRKGRELVQLKGEFREGYSFFQ